MGKQIADLASQLEAARKEVVVILEYLAANEWSDKLPSDSFSQHVIGILEAEREAIVNLSIAKEELVAFVTGRDEHAQEAERQLEAAKRENDELASEAQGYMEDAHRLREQLATITAENKRIEDNWQSQVNEMSTGMRKMRGRIATLTASIPCSGCGMVYPGKPSTEPWICDKCMQESDGEIDRLTASLASMVAERDKYRNAAKTAGAELDRTVEELAEVTKREVKLREACDHLHQRFHGAAGLIGEHDCCTELKAAKGAE